MNTFGTIFLLANAAAILLLPLRWAALPLLMGACYMTLGQGVELGPLHFPVIRILIAVGLVRVALTAEGLARGINALDVAMVAWALWAVGSSTLHEDISTTLVNRLGLVYNACGIYFLLRVFCRSVDDVFNLCRITALLLIPLSLEMLAEHATGRNLFAALGGVDEFSELRNGIIRAQGPFAHPILAGSVGAASLPLMFVIWRRHRTTALAGMAACLAMVYASTSSGPVLSTALAIGALAMWRWRSRMQLLRWIGVLGYIVLNLLMNAPAYYLLARVDVTGNSTSWHRAELINAAVTHLSEWWLGGTDYTRHWMSYGVGWSGNHIDITNYYIMMGVYGGLALMLLFIAVLAIGFSFVGQAVRRAPVPTSMTSTTAPFAMWALGAALFAHAATFVSVSYFDQSVVFLYLTLAAICAGHRGTQPARVEAAATAGFGAPTALRSLSRSPGRFEEPVDALTVSAKRQDGSPDAVARFSE